MICNMTQNYVMCSKKYALLIAAQLFGSLVTLSFLINVNWNYCNIAISSSSPPYVIYFIDFILEFGFVQIHS